MENVHAAKVLIADDEALARRRIVDLLKDDPRVSSLIEAVDGEDAVEKISADSPDIVFLDIQMPGCDGFEVLRRVHSNDAVKIPEIVFVTAFDEFSLKAFEFHAIDYLLKPFTEERLHQGFERTLKRLQAPAGSGLDRGLLDLVKELTNKPSSAEWFSIKEEDKLSLFPIDQVAWIEAQGNYISISANGKTHLIREKMESVESRLDAASFLRIHRSTIVNVNYISEIEVWGRGEYKVAMRGGRLFPVSRGYRTKLDEFFAKRVL